MLSLVSPLVTLVRSLATAGSSSVQEVMERSFFETNNLTLCVCVCVCVCVCIHVHEFACVSQQVFMNRMYNPLTSSSLYSATTQSARLVVYRAQLVPEENQ